MKVDENISNEPNIDQLKLNMFSTDWELVKSSAEELGKIGGNEIVDFLISLLAQSDSGIRNQAALALADIKDSRAVNPLFNAILKKENQGFVGTLVFALEEFDCSKYLREVFEIMFYQNYESKMSAISILNNQIFEFSRQDLVFIQALWEKCLANPETCPDIEDEDVKEEMQEIVDGYLEYLKE